MTNLQVGFIPNKEISPELQNEIDVLDHLAFADENHDDPEFNSIDWSARIEYMALGRADGELVTLFGLLRREILVGGQSVWVVGIGGVATHPNWQKRGFSSALLQAADLFMRERMDAPFGLLICADERLSFYGRTGWKHVADKLFFTQDNKRRLLKTNVMILSLADQSWPSGEIDLCGSPW